MERLTTTADRIARLQRAVALGLGRKDRTAQAQAARLIRRLRADPALTMQLSGLSPDPWQQRVLRSTSRQLALCCTRQGGKSQVVGAACIHHALTCPGTLTLVVSRSQRQSGEFFRGRLMPVYRRLGMPVAATRITQLELELANGSRVISLPGRAPDTILGYTADMLVLDEAAKIPDELYYLVRPFLAVTGGRLIALSTPFGRRGWFWEEWAGGGRGWERVSIKAVQCPRIGKSFLDRERKSLGDRYYRQAYECEFLEPLDSVFRSDDVAYMVAAGDRVAPLWGWN